MNAAAKGDPPKHLATIGLGSNIEPEINLPKAVGELRTRLNILCTSSAWRSPALGTSGPDFLNAVVQLETELAREALKDEILRPIEAELGRRRGTNKNAPRTLDLDILIFDGQIVDPHIWEFAHLALPLSECLPELVEPSSQRTIAQIASDLQRRFKIQRETVALG